ncbi:hypothetical protein [Desulforamulus hydrothermalis]|uniref:Uncharacterized protein n=1 Tax=Desulforamulus hydrothermalis Lam5 = DSM 18033 TaxID=1121428 RepID=K8E047_9FIRM|nr:hypothetical protein [Desulforamulus hydrothermalis]CCO08842.1 hypothetical protein DESHY_60014 [Desulforamulus hydrothermalis Lam5 = DSM 18033]SHG72981.1 hypothetical protein SAMN02745177_00157 [Desulforamulus hydrothermalis Lam5 = DSM 18033]
MADTFKTRRSVIKPSDNQAAGPLEISKGEQGIYHYANIKQLENHLIQINEKLEFLAAKIKLIDEIYIAVQEIKELTNSAGQLTVPVEPQQTLNELRTPTDTPANSLPQANEPAAGKHKTVKFDVNAFLDLG